MVRLALYQRQQPHESCAKAGSPALEKLELTPARGQGRRTTRSRYGAAATELREWQSDPARPMNPDEFARDVLPRIQGIPLSALMAATGLSLRYVSRIRGEKTPHPPHWENLRRAEG